MFLRAGFVLVRLEHVDGVVVGFDAFGRHVAEGVGLVGVDFGGEGVEEGFDLCGKEVLGLVWEGEGDGRDERGHRCRVWGR